MVLELSGILKAKDAVQLSPSSSFKPPPIHKLFSSLEFIRGGSGMNVQRLEAADIVEISQHFNEDDTPSADTRSMMTSEQQGGWLDSDDIEEFD